MKKFLIGIVFGIALFLTQKTNITYAANLSDNFTQILIDNDQNNLLNNSEIAHISVKFNDQKNKFTKDSTMFILLNSNKKDVHVQALNEVKKLIIKDDTGEAYQVGKYIVKNNQVQVIFDKNIEKFENISGQIDFDIQISNETTSNQFIQIEAGEINEKIYVSSRPQVNKNVVTEISGKYNSDKNKIAWEIKINSENKSELQIFNTIENQNIDQDTLKIKIDGNLIKLNKNNIEFNKGLKLKLVGKDIVITYITSASEVSSVLNIVRVIEDNENQHVTSAKVQVNDIVNIDGKFNQTSTNKKQREKKISKFFSNLAKLIIDKKQEKTDQNNDEKSQFELAQSTALANAKSTKHDMVVSSKTPSLDDTFEHNIDDKEVKETINESIPNTKKAHSKKHSANKSNLPKTGEDNIELFFSIVGTIFLSISAIFFYKKSRK